MFLKCAYISTGGHVDELLLEGMTKVKFRTMKEMYGGTEEFEQPTKACTFAASLCVSFWILIVSVVYFVSGSCLDSIGHGFGFQVVILMKFIVWLWPFGVGFMFLVCYFCWVL